VAMNYQYIAGFFDGEGTTRIEKSENRVSISIPQTNLLVLQKIQKFCGFGRICKVKKEKSIGRILGYFL